MPRKKQTALGVSGQMSYAGGLAETLSAKRGASSAVDGAASTSLNSPILGKDFNGGSLTSTTRSMTSAGIEGIASTGNAQSASEAQDLRRRKLAASTPDKVEPLTSSSQSMETPKPSKQRSWLFLALASGTFAALNGAFAKLTTASHTTAITNAIAAILHVSIDGSNAWYRILDIGIRAFFFGLNLISNGIMWALFTRALTAHDSATSVSILNTSANFLVTATIGALGFSEKLPARWFLGAAFLLVGSVVIGRKAREDDGLRQEARGERAAVDAEGQSEEAVSLLDVDAREEVIR